MAATVGEEKALRVYQALLGHVRQEALAVAAARYLFYSDFIEKKDGWPPQDFIKRKQHGHGIGERMSNAFEQVLQRHEKVVLVGSDLPQLSAAILKEAFEKLEGSDFVIGPALDGGYYLLGMKTYEPGVFQNIEWSTPRVFAETIRRIEALRKTYSLLPVLSDVDNEADWEKYGWEIG